MPNPQGVNPRQRSMQSMAVAVCMFVMGGCGMAYEYTLSKIASDILGNSVQQWAIVIALMLFCMGMGAELQRHVKDRKLIDTLAQSQAALALLGGFGSLAMLHVFSAFPSHFALVQYGLVSAIGTLIGFEIPLITRINEQFSADVKSNLARILKMDYIGALIGALLWVFVLFRYFSMVQTGLILALTTLLSTLGLVAAFRNRTENLGRLCASIVGVGVLVAAFSSRNRGPNLLNSAFTGIGSFSRRHRSISTSCSRKVIRGIWPVTSTVICSSTAWMNTSTTNSWCIRQCRSPGVGTTC